MESKYYSPYCTLCAQKGIRTDLAPHEGIRTRGWVYCEPCYISRFSPEAAKKRGLIKELPPKPVKPKKVKKPAKPVQLALFEIPNHKLPPCDCTGAFNHQEVK